MEQGVTSLWGLGVTADILYHPTHAEMACPSPVPRPMGLVPHSLSVLGQLPPLCRGQSQVPRGREGCLGSLRLVSEVMTIFSVTAALGLS